MKTDNKHFTLIELLVCMAIIGILASLLLPSLIMAKYQAQNTLCINRLKQMTMATMMSAQDHDEFYPDRGESLRHEGKVTWGQSDYDNGMHGSGIYMQNRMDNAYVDIRDELGDYAALSDPVWVCPLYTPRDYVVANDSKSENWQDYNGCSAGGYMGCPEHGVNHVRSNNGKSHMSYDFWGGLSPINWSASTWGAPWTQKRLKVGDPLKLTDGKGGKSIADLSVLWADSLHYDRSNKAGFNGFPLYFDYMTYHRPPPNSSWAYVWRDRDEARSLQERQRGRISVMGRTVSNHGFDDGSVRSIMVPPRLGTGGEPDGEFHVLKLSGGLHFKYLPKEN